MRYELNVCGCYFQTMHNLKIKETKVFQGNGDILYSAICRLSTNYYECIIGFGHAYKREHRRSLKEAFALVESYYVESNNKIRKPS